MKNLGTLDRALRVIAVTAIVIAYATGNLTGTPGMVLLLIAIVLLATAAIGFCPAYRLFGASTCDKS